MLLNRIAIALFVLCVAAVAAHPQSEAPRSGASAQSTPKKERVDPDLKDLAGEWELVVKESDYRAVPPYTGGSLTVRVVGQEVTIKRLLEDSHGSREREFSYHGDGRGEVNILFAADGSKDFERPSRSNWKKGKLVIKISEKTNMGWIDIEEAYALSSDGKKLTYTYIPRLASAGMFRPSATLGKLVFRKKA